MQSIRDRHAAVRGLLLSVFLGVMLALPSASAASLAGLPDKDAAKAADKCQKQIGKSGEKFVKDKLKKLDKCLAGIFKCIQTQSAAKQPACIAKAAGKCDKGLQKIFDKDEPKLESGILKKCQVVGKIDLPEVLAADGLGFNGIATLCQTNWGINLNGVDDVAECIRREKECTIERLLRLQFPRASELLASAGVNAGLVSNFTCLMGSMTPGGAFGDIDPKNIGKPLDKCAKETKKAGAKFAVAKIKSIEKCLGAIFKCAQTKPGDQKCIDKAAGKCGKEFGAGGKIAKAEGKLRSSVQKKCGPAPFTELNGTMGMNFDDVESACATYGVPTIANLNDYMQRIQALIV